jgi:hypothetical protein
MSDSPQYGENGFVPTVSDVSWQGDTLVMETIDASAETDLVGLPGEELQYRGETVTEEQSKVLSLYEKN